MIFHGTFLPWMRRAGAWLFWPALALVAWGELTPHPPRLEGVLLWDKMDHVAAYFGLMLLASLGWGLRRSLLWVLLGLVMLGGLLEVLQSFTGRDAELGDLAANVLGAMMGLAVGMAYLAAPRRLVASLAAD